MLDEETKECQAVDRSLRLYFSTRVEVSAIQRGTCQNTHQRFNFGAFQIRGLELNSKREFMLDLEVPQLNEAIDLAVDVAGKR